jgi:hypothetical protein
MLGACTTAIPMRRIAEPEEIGLRARVLVFQPFRLQDLSRWSSSTAG